MKQQYIIKYYVQDRQFIENLDFVTVIHEQDF